MAALVVKNFKAADGKFEALGDFFNDVLGDTRAFGGCLKVDVYEDESASTDTLIEEWETFSAHDNDVRWRTERGDLSNWDGELLGGGFEDGIQTDDWGAKTDL